MNLEHLEILEQGVAGWNRWRQDNPDIRPALNHASLISTDLQLIDLREANLREATLWKSDLKRAALMGADLSNGNLSKVNLMGADLSEATLTQVKLVDTNLSGANLMEANLNQANLSGANMRGATLHLADLSNANLSAVDLHNAILMSTNLTGAIVKGADFSEVRCNAVQFTNIDLSNVNGLETIQHGGPSTIDINTLVKSKGKIPEVFLRGCGVPDEIIAYIPSLFGGIAIEFYSCFISYSHADKAFARRVHDTLQGRGIRCWLDEHQMLPGHDIFKEVDRGIRLWDKVLLCASKNSLTSWWVDNELETLFEKERGLMREHGDKIGALIPLDLDGYLFTDACPTPKKTQIQSRLAANFQGWETDNALFEREIERVIKALRTDEGREPPPPPKLGK